MNIVDEIEHLYSVLNNEYSIKEFIARKNGYIKAENLWKHKKELNEQAYFLFLFTRLEGHVRKETAKIIDKNQKGLIGWKKQAVWRIFPNKANLDGITFLNRVSLLTDKGKNEYTKITDYYKLRNELGHGGDTNIPINMVDVFDDMSSFFKTLKA